MVTGPGAATEERELTDEQLNRLLADLALRDDGLDAETGDPAVAECPDCKGPWRECFCFALDHDPAGVWAL